MIIAGVLFIWVFVGFFLYYVVEPWLRLRHGIKLAKDKFDQDMIRTMGSLFWPFTLFFYPFIRFIIFPVGQWLSKMTDKADEFWARKPEKKTEDKSIDSAKSGYRNVEFQK